MMMMVTAVHTSCFLIPNLSTAFQLLLHPSHLRWLPDFPPQAGTSAADKPHLLPGQRPCVPSCLRTSICGIGRVEEVDSLWSCSFPSSFSPKRRVRRREDDLLAERCLGTYTYYPPSDSSPPPLLCMASRWLSGHRLWVSRSEGSSPGIKLSGLCLEILKVTSTLGLCNLALNYKVCFCSLFSVSSRT